MRSPASSDSRRGAGYIQKGFQGSDEDDLLGALGGHAALSYVDFSALARIGNSPVHALLGTSIGIPVSCEVGVSIEGTRITADCDGHEVDINPAVDIGLTVGIGSAPWRGLLVNLLFTESLRDAAPDIEGRNRSLSLVVGAQFTVGER